MVQIGGFESYLNKSSRMCRRTRNLDRCPEGIGFGSEFEFEFEFGIGIGTGSYGGTTVPIANVRRPVHGCGMPRVSSVTRALAIPGYAEWSLLHGRG